MITKEQFQKAVDNYFSLENEQIKPIIKQIDKFILDNVPALHNGKTMKFNFELDHDFFQPIRDAYYQNGFDISLGKSETGYCDRSGEYTIPARYEIKLIKEVPRRSTGWRD